MASRVLDLVRSLELCDWHHCEIIQHRLGLAEGTIADKYAQSLRWASAMLGQELQS